MIKFIFVMLLFGCDNSPTLYPYEITLSYDEINGSGSGFIQVEKKERVLVENDSTAYVKGLFHAAASERTNKMLSDTPLGEGNVYYFSVYDSLGESVGSKLGVLKIEAINNRILNVDQSLKEKFLY